MKMIEAEGLSHDYKIRNDNGEVIGEKHAVKNVSLEVEPGQFIGILGKNGSGKSTFAKHLNAILLPTEGSLFIDGMDTKDEEKLWAIRQMVGMVFQNPDNQIIASVVEEDVGFGPENLGVPTDEIWERVEKSLDNVGMLEYRKHSPNMLSGGQKQRIAIAGILAMHPKCIVLDEATAMLDPMGRKDVVKTALRLNKEEGMTVIFITHYMEEVVDADYIYVMDAGEIKLSGTPKEVFSKVDELEEAGLTVPVATRMACELKKKGFDLPEGILTKDELIEAVGQLYK